MIVIPMAGMSSRFTAAGYDQPKYMLPLHGAPVFDHAVGSFQTYFADTPFLFIARGVAGTAHFIADRCAALGIADAQTIILTAPTAGQAETVELGIATLPPETPLTIFNIDTFRPGFHFPSFPEASAGYLEVFEGAGANWSYVRPAEKNQRVAETAEKRPISNLCCTGLYHFAQAVDFQTALAAERGTPSAPELYVAPLYNHLIAAGHPIHYDLIPGPEIIFCGVPAEYEALLQQPELPAP